DRRHSMTRNFSIGLILLVACGCCCNNKSDAGSSAAGSSSAATMTSIEDITWNLANVGGTPAAPVPTDGKAAHFRLNSKDKRYTGYSSVNNFNGPYELNGQSLKFRPAAMTRMMGIEPFNTQEQAFIDALNKTASWRVTAGGIELLDSAGNSLASFT